MPAAADSASSEKVSPPLVIRPPYRLSKSIGFAGLLVFVFWLSITFVQRLQVQGLKSMAWVSLFTMLFVAVRLPYELVLLLFSSQVILAHEGLVHRELRLGKFVRKRWSYEITKVKDVRIVEHVIVRRGAEI